MSLEPTRRRFLRASIESAVAGGALLGLGGTAALGALRPVSDEEAAIDPRIVRFDPEIEPLVRLLEDTPRDKLLEAVAARIRSGTTYREILTALLLAGIRNIQPRPSVGFKFHAVLVVNSAHIASLASPDSERWLPIFWALDHFKASQARDVEEGDWTMAAVDESKVPDAHGARAAFREAMESWDVEAADAAVTGFVRAAGAQAVFDEFFRLGARDFRAIGHKAIYVSNSWRTLACIGWQHAEPVARSLAYALLQHEGENPSKRDAEPDRPGRRNAELAGAICGECLGGGADNTEATADLLASLRDGSDEDAAAKVVALLKKDVSARSIWDAIFEGAGELVIRQPGIVALHAATTANALHFAFQTAGDARTRAFALLQAASFVPLFRGAAQGRGTLADRAIDAIPAEKPEGEIAGSPAAAVEAIFAEVSRDRASAARKALGFLAATPAETRPAAARALIDRARLLVFLKGNDAHDYKYSSAVLEDYFAMSRPVRDRYLASALFLLPGSGDRDNGLVQRTRAALA